MEAVSAHSFTDKRGLGAVGGCGHRPEPRAGGTLWPALPLYLISFDVSNRQLPRGLVDTFSELLLLSVYPPASIPGGPGRDALQWSLCLGQLLAQPLGSMRPVGAKGTHLCEALGMGEPALPLQTFHHHPTYTHTQWPKGRGTRAGRPEPGRWSGGGW